MASGLACYLFSQDLALAWRMAEVLSLCLDYSFDSGSLGEDLRHAPGERRLSVLAASALSCLDRCLANTVFTAVERIWHI